MRTYVYGICLMKDEADFLQYQLENCLNNKLDGLIISDIMSEDGSRDILEYYRKRFSAQNVDYTIIDERQFGYFQAIKFNGMAKMAYEKCAGNHKSEFRMMIQPFDADELWTCPTMALGDLLRGSPIDFWWTGMRTMICTSRDEKRGPNPTKRIRHFLAPGDPRDEISRCKVIYRYGKDVWLELGAHRTRMANMDTIREDGGRRGPLIHHIEATARELVFRHYPARSPEQFIRKIRNNAAAMEKNQKAIKANANRHSVKLGKLSDAELTDYFMNNHFEEDVTKVKFDPWKGVEF